MAYRVQTLTLAVGVPKRVRMMSSKICIIGLIFISSLVSYIYANDQGTGNVGKNLFKLPSLFTFSNFKQQFSRNYRSLSEELARQRIYLARAFKVFMSAVNYRYKKSSSYLAINELSDWTKQEVKRTHMKASVVFKNRAFKNEEPLVDSLRPEAVEDIPVASESDIQSALSKVLAEQDREPGYEKIAHTLYDEDKQDEKTRDLPLGTLLRNSIKSKEVSESVASNNHNYMAPELTSYGIADTGGWLESMSRATSELILQVPGSRFVESALRAGSAELVSTDRPTNDREKNKTTDASVEEDELFIDHRTSNCLFEPRFQGDCGSCYSFATMALYEWNYCKATGHKVALSEQYIVDCGELAGLLGCDGGYPPYINEFVHKYGLELRTHYPYLARKNSCPYEKSTPPSKMGYLRVHDAGQFEIDLDELETHLVNGPIVTILYMDDEFSDYGGGVRELAEYKRKEDDLHAVLLIGSGRENGKEYWLFRNSYGSTWGERGNFKLSKDCGHLVLSDAFEMKKFVIPRTTRKREVSEQVKRRLEQVKEETHAKRQRLDH